MNAFASEAWPDGVVTVTVTVAGDPRAGVMAVSVWASKNVVGAVTPPIVTIASAVKKSPAIVIVVPPPSGPSTGSIAVRMGVSR